MIPDNDYFQNKNRYNKKYKYPSLEEILSLQEDEQILWKGKPNGKSFVLGRIFKMMPIALLWLVIDGGFIFGITYVGITEGLPFYAYIIFIVFFAVHLTPVWVWIASIVSAFRRLRNTEYAFTDKRVVIKSGYFGGLQNIYYSDIASVNLSVGFFDRIFHVGDIVIRTNAGDTHMVEDIEDPYFICGRLQKITLDIKTDMQYPNDLRPEENHGYRTKYIDRK